MTFFFSGPNYVKTGFGGNITNRKKTYSRLAGYVFQQVRITTGKNYDRKKNNVQLSGCQLKTGKNYVRKKGTAVSSCWLEGKTQNTTHIIDTTTNKPYPPVALPPLSPWVEQWCHQIMAPPLPNTMSRPQPIRVALAVVSLLAWGGKIRGSK